MRAASTECVGHIDSMTVCKAEQTTTTAGGGKRRWATFQPSKPRTWCTNRSCEPSSGAMKPACGSGTSGWEAAEAISAKQNSDAHKRDSTLCSRQALTVALRHVEPLASACEVLARRRVSSKRVRADSSTGSRPRPFWPAAAPVDFDCAAQNRALRERDAYMAAWRGASICRLPALWPTIAGSLRRANMLADCVVTRVRAASGRLLMCSSLNSRKYVADSWRKRRLLALELVLGGPGCAWEPGFRSDD